MDDEPCQREPRGNPHEHKHPRPHGRADIQFLLRLGSILEDKTDDRADDTGRQHEDGDDEAGNGERQTPPPRFHHQRRQEDEEKRQDAPGQEEPEHDLARDPQHGQDRHHLTRQGDRGSGQQFPRDGLHRIPPEERLGLGTEGDPLIVISLAVVPQPDLVEVVQSQGLCDGVDELGVGHGGGDDVG